MNENQVKLLIAQGEGKGVDFKRELDLDSARNKAEFVKDVISLANSADKSGYLIIGVADDHSVIGVSEIEEERIQQIAYTYTSPPVGLQCYLVSINAPVYLSVGVIEVEPQSRPHKVARGLDRLNKDDVFVRRGSVVMRASPEEIIRMREADTWQRGEVRQLMEAAQTHIQLGNYDSAIVSYSKAIEIAPTPDLFLARAEVCVHIIEETDLEQKTQKGDLALKDFSDALSLANTTEQEKRGRLGRVQVWASHNHSRDNDDWDLWTEDVEWLRNNTEGYEKGELLYLEVLMGENNVGIDEDAFWLTTIDEAIAQGYDEPEAFFFRAFAHFYNHNYGLSLDDVSRAIESGFRQTLFLRKALCLKAIVLARMKRYSEAYMWFLELRHRSGWEFFGYLSSSLEKDILCRCALIHEFSGEDDRSRTLKELILLLRPWLGAIKKEYPRISETLQGMLSD